MLLNLFLLILIVELCAGASTGSTAITPERALLSLELGAFEDSHPSTPEQPGFFRFSRYKNEWSSLVYHYELNLEVLMSSGLYKRPLINPHVGTWVYWLRELMPTIHLRFVKKMFSQYAQTTEEQMMQFLGEFADQVEGDNDIIELLDESTVQGSFRHELMERLSEKGRFLRAVKDHDLRFLTVNKENMTQEIVDLAFDEAVTVYLADTDKPQLLRESADVLSFLAIHTSKKALQTAHPRLTRSAHNLIYKARGEEDKLEKEPKKPEQDENEGVQTPNLLVKKGL